MGGSPASFSDIGKRAKDLLTKDYSFDRMLTLSMSRVTRMGLTTIGLRKDKIFFNNLHKRGNTIIDVKVDTYSNISTKVTVNGFLPSTKAAISFKLADHKSSKDKLDMWYLHDDYASYYSTSLNPTLILELSAATESNELTLGGEVGFDAASGSFTKVSAGIGLNKPDFSGALLLTGKGQTLKASYVRFVSPVHSVAAELSLSLSAHENIFTIGSSHALDPLTVVKTRFSDGKLAMLWQNEWRPKSLVTVSAEYDSRAIHTLALKCGLTLVLKP